MVDHKDPAKEIHVPDVPEITAGTNVPDTGKSSSFPALKNKRYRYFFAGQFISVIGTWMQIVAQGWLVLQLSNSAFYLGLVAAMATTPSLLFSLFGGVVVDRFNKKKILFYTQLANALLALTLGVLTLAGLVSIPVICVIAFLMGTVNAVDAPARQAFVSTIVTREELPSAIALNSGIFNAARAVGPAISGLLIAYVGSGLAFILNGISYVALIIALTFIEYNITPQKIITAPLMAIRDGIQYVFQHPIIRVLIVFTGVLSIFGWSYSTVMPHIAKNIYGLNAKGLGYMYTSTGLGSLLATYLVGAFARRISPIIFIMGGNALFALSLMIFSFSPPLPFALLLLFFMGMGLLSQAATINTLIQTIVKNEFRGRVMSLYVLMFLGMAPLGNFEVGTLTEQASLRMALLINSVMVITFGLLVFTYRGRIRNAYLAYKEQRT